MATLERTEAEMRRRFFIAKKCTLTLRRRKMLFLTLFFGPLDPSEQRKSCYSCAVPHYFYLARCADDSLYSGTCIDLKDREAKHNAGEGAKYTRSRRPVRIIYHEEFETLSEARKREAEVKRFSKEQKEILASSR